MRKKQIKGLSLIELLCVLAIIGVISAWGWPNYQSTVQRSQRALARTALLQAAHWLERSASVNGSYPAPAQVPAAVLKVEGEAYRLSVDSDSNRFLLKAEPQGAQLGDACGSLSLNHVGERGVMNASLTAAECWRR